jgi:hypothetical protein
MRSGALIASQSMLRKSPVISKQPRNGSSALIGCAGSASVYRSPLSFVKTLTDKKHFMLESKIYLGHVTLIFIVGWIKHSISAKNLLLKIQSLKKVEHRVTLITGKYYGQ